MGPDILAAGIASAKIKRPSALRTVVLSENTHPRITFFFFFLQMETTKDENLLQYEKARIKAFKLKQGRRQGFVSCTYLYRSREERDIQRDRLAFRKKKKLGKRLFAHMFIFATNPDPLKKNTTKNHMHSGW